MQIDMSYFRSVQNASGLSTNKEVVTEEARNRLRCELTTSINYEPESERNGVAQPLVVAKAKDANDECFVIALPYDELCLGDIIDCYSQKWIVTELFPNNMLHYRGKMRLCNHLFKFQNGTSSVIERWGAIETGTSMLSTDKSDTIVVPLRQYRIYMRLDSDTEYLYVDKRISIGKMRDKNGNYVLSTIKVTSVDNEIGNWGDGKLLVLCAESDNYNVNTDSVSEQICDYIAAGSTAPSGGVW